MAIGGSMKGKGDSMGAIRWSKRQVEAKHCVRVEKFRRDSKKLKYLEK